MNGIVVNGFARTSTDSGNTVPGFLDLASDIAFGILLISFPTSQAALEGNAVPNPPGNKQGARDHRQGGTIARPRWGPRSLADQAAEHRPDRVARRAG